MAETRAGKRVNLRRFYVNGEFALLGSEDNPKEVFPFSDVGSADDTHFHCSAGYLFEKNPSPIAQSPRWRDVTHDYIRTPNFDRQRAWREGHEVRRVGELVWVLFGVVTLCDRIQAPGFVSRSWKGIKDNGVEGPQVQVFKGEYFPSGKVLGAAAPPYCPSMSGSVMCAS